MGGRGPEPSKGGGRGPGSDWRRPGEHVPTQVKLQASMTAGREGVGQGVITPEMPNIQGAYVIGERGARRHGMLSEVEACC